MHPKTSLRARCVHGRHRARNLLSPDDTAKEIHDSPASRDDIVNTSVSGDGIWQRKGFSSFIGVFAAISIESAKVLDVEPMSRYCKGCNLKKGFKSKKLNCMCLMEKCTYISMQLQRLCRKYGG